jgi:hypothetical protein
MPPVVLTFVAFITFKSGNARGHFNVKLIARAPSGLKINEASMPILLEGDERGANVIANYQLHVDQEGLYWFDVYLADKLVTKIPFRVMYQRANVTTPPQL